jgi:hypothetical protein
MTMLGVHSQPELPLPWLLLLTIDGNNGLCDVDAVQELQYWMLLLSLRVRTVKLYP